MKLSISMTRRETMLGWSYLLVSMFALPFAFSLVNALLGAPLSETDINILYFSLNFICVAVIFRRFLRESVKLALGTPWRCLRIAAISLLLYRAASILLAVGIVRLDPGFSNINDGFIAELSQEHYALMAFATVFLVPVYEEVLHRGLIFQGLHAKSRVLAYTVSMLVFASIHVMGYVGLYNWLTLLLCFIQYLPAGAALAWAYEKADTIAAPILMHIAINLIGFAAMR